MKERGRERSLRVSMISVHFLCVCMRSYDCDISNRWINNTEKTIENDEKKKGERERPICDYWLHCEFFAALLLLLLCLCAFFFISSRFFALCSTEPAECISRQKVHTTFFRITSQARSVPFFSPLSLSLSHISAAAPCECVNVLIFLSSSSLVVFCAVAADASLKRSLFCLLLWFVSSQKAFSFMCTSQRMCEYRCVQNTHASLDHKGSCWCVSKLVQCLCSFALSFHLPSPSFCADAFFASASMA